MLGVTAFVGGGSTAQGIMWFGVGTVLGWPFAAALIFPFVAEELLVASVTSDIAGTATRFVDGTVRSLVVLVRLLLGTCQPLIANCKVGTSISC